MQALLLRFLLLFMVAAIVFPAYYTVTTSPLVYPKVPYSNFYDDLEEDRPIHRVRRQWGWGGPWGYGRGPWGWRRPWGWGPRPWGFGGPYGYWG